MKAVNEGRLDITPSVVAHWDLCIQCRACEVACPSGVPYGHLMEGTRREVAQRFRRPLAQRAIRAIVFGLLLPHSRWVRESARALRLYQRTGLRKAVRAARIFQFLPKIFERLDDTLPNLSDNFFIAKGQVFRAQGARKARVALLSGCVMPLVHASTLRATTRVLVRNGVEVILPQSQGCCGALNLHAGDSDRALKMAKRNVDSFLQVEPDAVVVASAGCGSIMKEYGDLLSGDETYAEGAKRLASITRDIHEFLVNLPFEPPKSPLALKTTYQDACHLISAQRITRAPRQILRAIPGLELTEIDEPSICCGSGGTYSLTEHAMANRLGSRKIANVTATGASVIATSNPGCAMQLNTHLRRAEAATQVRYVVDLLDEAYSLDDSRIKTPQSD